MKTKQVLIAVGVLVLLVAVVLVVNRTNVLESGQGELEAAAGAFPMPPAGGYPTTKSSGTTYYNGIRVSEAQATAVSALSQNHGSFNVTFSIQDGSITVTYADGYTCEITAGGGQECYMPGPWKRMLIYFGYD